MGNVRSLSLLLVLLFGSARMLLVGEVQAETIKIGAILPLSGDMAAVGAAARDAMQLALEDVRGKTSYRYELVFEDDKLTPHQVPVAAQKLISIDRVSALVSTWSYGGTIVAPLATRAKLPHIGVAWDHRIADGRFNFLHLTPPSEFMSKFLEVFQRTGVTRVALVGIEESGSVFAFDEFERLAPRYGVSVVFREAAAWDQKEFRSLVSRVRSRAPEYLLMNVGGEGQIVGLLNALRHQRVPFRVTGITSFDVLAELSPVEGAWYVSDSYLSDDFAERFKRRFGHSIRYGIGNFYEATRLLIRAYEETHGDKRVVSPQDAAMWLRSVRDLPSILGPTSVSPQGVFSYPARLIEIRSEERVLTTLDELVKRLGRTDHSPR